MQELTNLWTFLTAWYNLPFFLALLAFLGLSALQFVGLGQDHDVDADADADLDLDVDHDFDLDHDLDLDHDADLNHNLDYNIAELPTWANVLEFLGVGHAPVTMILLVLMGSFGILGWIANSLVLGIYPIYPGWALVGVLVGTLLISVWFTSRTSRFIGRAIPAFASTATSTTRLVGKRGYVISPQVDEKYGQVKLRDSGGNLLTIFAVVDPGKPSIPRDAEVYLVDYDATKKIFTIVPSED